MLLFDAFGKDGIKKCRVSPDAFCQMAYQLAYYRTYTKVTPTYESCSVRQYLHGRTETIRSCRCVSRCEWIGLIESETLNYFAPEHITEYYMPRITNLSRIVP